MGDPYKGKLAGHALAIGGMGSGWYTKHPFRAKCECGEESEPLETVAQRREWHRQHKADMIDTFAANGIDDRGREVHL